MSAMERMFSDMLMKAIPDEVRGLLTQENLEKLQNNIKATHNHIIGSLNHLVQKQAEQDAKLEEILEHVRNSNNRGAKRLPTKCSDCGQRHDGDCPT